MNALRLFGSWLCRWPRHIWIFVLVVGLSFVVFQSAFRVIGDQIWMDGKQYSDFAAHLPLIRSFSVGWNFPPEYPFVAGQPIKYHYFFYLLVGLLERAGLRLDFALNGLSALGFGLLVTMIYRYAVLFFRRSRVGILAITLFLLNGSLSWYHWLVTHDLSLNSLLSIVTERHFAQFGPWNGDAVSAFWNLNIYTNQRHLGLGFGLALAIVFPLVAATHRSMRLANYQKLLLVISATLMPLVHQAGATYAVGMIAAWLIFYWRRLPSDFKRWYGLILFCLVSALTLYLPGGFSALAPKVGFLATDQSLDAILLYWWHNLGLYLVLIPILLWWGGRRVGRWLWLHYSLFAAANLFLLSRDAINNHKYINLFMLGMVVVAAGWLDWLWRTGKWRQLLVVSIFPFLILSGIFDIFPILNDSSGPVADPRRQELGQVIFAAAKEAATRDQRLQVLTGSYMYSPASMMGQTLFLDYGYHAWSMGYEDGEKRAALPVLFGASTKLSQWCEVARQFKITHVLLGPFDPVQLENGPVLADSQIAQQPTNYQNEAGWRWWDVVQVCQGN